MNITIRFACALIGSLSGVALAGPMTEVVYSAQVLQYTKDGAIDGCGVRLVGMPTPVPGQQSVPTLDVSFNVANPGGGIVKGGLMAVPMSAVLAGDLSKSVEVPIKSVWLKTAGKAATRPLNGKAFPATTHRHALMYPTRLEEVLDLIAAMHGGQTIQVGFLVTAQDMEQVYFGKVHLSDADNEQFGQCFLEWSDALQRRLGEVPKN